MASRMLVTGKTQEKYPFRAKVGHKNIYQTTHEQAGVPLNKVQKRKKEQEGNGPIDLRRQGHEK